MSKKDEILRVLSSFANEKGYVKGLDTTELASKVHLSKHDVNKALWDINKEGLLGFSAMKGGEDGSTILYRFRFTKTGMNQVIEETNKRARQTVGIEVSEETKAIARKIPTSTDKGSWISRNVRIGKDDAGASPEATAVQAPSEAELDKAETEAAQRPDQTPPGYVYPTLVTLLDRKRLAEQAAQNLEALGADNLALKALELADAPLTPLQKDVARFFVDYPGFVKFALKVKKEAK